MTEPKIPQKVIDLMDQMFDVRRANNLNWRMALENLVRYAPREVTMNIFEQIYDNDHQISVIFAQIREAIATNAASS